MSLTQLSLPEQRQNLGLQLQKPQTVGDRGAVF